MKYAILLIFLVNCGIQSPVQKSTLKIWDSKNLPVSCFHNDVSEYWEDLYNHAVREMNFTLGFELFEYCTPWGLSKPFPADLRKVILFDVEDLNVGGRTVITYNKFTLEILGVKITINPRSNYNVHYSIILHEMGHAVGLMHDEDDKASLMYPSIGNHEKFFQKEDLEYLKRTYKER